MKQDLDFYKNPENYLSIDEIGDLELDWFTKNYVGLRFMKNKPIFDKAYEVLSQRGNFSKENAFGEMHGDGYLWIVPHDSVKVIVNEQQNFCYIYIDDGEDFHIRGLEYDGYYPSYRQHEFEGILVERFEQQGFKPSCPEDGTKRFNAFTYGDGRDTGYVLSVYYSNYSNDCKYVNDRTLWGIRNMEFWSAYLDNPEKLE